MRRLIFFIDVVFMIVKVIRVIKFSNNLDNFNIFISLKTNNIIKYILFANTNNALDFCFTTVNVMFHQEAAVETVKMIFFRLVKQNVIYRYFRTLLCITTNILCL